MNAPNPAVPAPGTNPVYEHRGYLYNAGPISFRASGLDKAWRIVQALDALLKAELGDRAHGAVSLGFPRADDSNFAPRKRGGAS